MKDKVADILEETSPTDQHNITVGERRIAITHAVAAVWLWLRQYKQGSIIKVLNRQESLYVHQVKMIINYMYMGFQTLKLGHGSLSPTQSQMMNLLFCRI